MQSKLCSLLFLLSLYITSTFAQSTDSVLIENRINNVWRKKTLKILTYNNLCLNIKSLTKGWDTVAYKWINSNLSTKTFDDSGRVEQSKNQYWDKVKQKWVNNSLHIYGYASDGLTDSTTTLYWETGSKSWQQYWQYTRGFNNSGLMAYVLEKLYNKYIFLWQPSALTNHKYNKDNLITYSERDHWDNNAWENTDKREYKYSKDKSQGSSLSYDWNRETAEWIQEVKQQYEAIPGTTLERKRIMQQYNSSTNTWFNTTRIVSKYNSNLTLKLTEYAFWDAYSSQWLNNSRTRVGYYPDGSVHHIYGDLWNPTAKVWEIVSRTTYSHHGCNLEVSITRVDNNDEINRSGKNLNSRVSAYREINIIDEDSHDFSFDVQVNGGNSPQQSNANYHISIKASPVNKLITINKAPVIKVSQSSANKMFTISPNPAKGFFIVIPDKQLQTVDATLRLYDFSGKLIITQKLQATGAQKIYLSGTAKGMYMVTITSKTGSQNIKLMIE